MQLLITPLQLGLLLATIFVVLGVGIYAARSVSSAEGYTLGGRSAGTAMLAGSLAGTMVGGGATIGTAQLAASVGLSAWWFTLGSGISFILMGIFYARPLRRTNLETIPSTCPCTTEIRLERWQRLLPPWVFSSVPLPASCRA
jgi:solute:Na+ symporter, SSS family